jgi:lysine-N-methylase
MLEDGADEVGEAAPPSSGTPAGGEADPGTPLDPLPGFTLSCDGSGSCCRLYASIVFAPVEAARARALLPRILGGGDRHERVFMPERGSAPTGGAVVTLCDGRCAYLADSGRCGLHEAGGASAKPIGCAAFPATFTDDGEAVRVSVAVECACVLASIGREGGAPLLPPAARVLGDLPQALNVTRVPALVQVTPAAMAQRADFIAWSVRVSTLLPRPDTAAALVSLGATVARGGLTADPEPALVRPALVAPSSVIPWIDALRRRARRREHEDAAWRSEHDLARRAMRWIAAATEALLDRAVLEALVAAPASAPADESFYVRALLHGRTLATAELPLSLGLHDRAVRLLVARALPLVLAGCPPGELDPACDHPLALVEAMLRGHGLDAYAYDVAKHHLHQ